MLRRICESRHHVRAVLTTRGEHPTAISKLLARGADFHAETTSDFLTIRLAKSQGNLARFTCQGVTLITTPAGSEQEFVDNSELFPGNPIATIVARSLVPGSY